MLECANHSHGVDRHASEEGLICDHVDLRGVNTHIPPTLPLSRLPVVRGADGVRLPPPADPAGLRPPPSGGALGESAGQAGGPRCGHQQAGSAPTRNLRGGPQPAGVTNV